MHKYEVKAGFVIGGVKFSHGDYITVEFGQGYAKLTKAMTSETATMTSLEFTQKVAQGQVKKL